MSILEQAGLKLLHRMDPERAHDAALLALRRGLAPKSAPPSSPRLTIEMAGMPMPNPIGLAAGFDKNARAVAALTQTGFGFLEVGAATPRPQPGNPKPRLFRLTEDRAVINRFGFNNDGADVIAERLATRPAGRIVGINLGANKTSEDKAADYATVLRICGPHVDFATVNVSSPNTEKLRDLQGKEALTSLLGHVQDANAALPQPKPIFLKVAPDLTEEQIDDIVEASLDQNIAAIITTNTTVGREGLQSADRSEAGGLSGKPLFDLSTRILAHFAIRLEQRIPLIGVGGIECADDVRTKFEAGASAVQLYSAMVYHGLSLAKTIAQDLDKQLHRDGVANIADLTASRAKQIASPL